MIKEAGHDSDPLLLSFVSRETKSHLDYLYISGFSMVSTFRN